MPDRVDAARRVFGNDPPGDLVSAALKAVRVGAVAEEDEDQAAA